MDRYARRISLNDIKMISENVSQGFLFGVDPEERGKTQKKIRGLLLQNEYAEILVFIKDFFHRDFSQRNIIIFRLL